MGLDMYLYKKTYVKNWSFQEPHEQFEVTVKKGGVTYPNIKSDRISYVEETIMYWRKANQIHGWFANNCSEKTPDVEYTLYTKQLQELLDTCKKVLGVLEKAPKLVTQVNGGWRDGKPYEVDLEVYDCKDEIEDLLPPVQGFFFGSYEIDGWYKEQIEETVKFLEEELPNCSEDDTFTYYASW